MKGINFFILTMSMLTTTAYAERIDEVSGPVIIGNSLIGGGSIPGAVKPGTQDKSCNKRVFLKRNSGTFVTNLKASNIFPYSILEYFYDSATNQTKVKAVLLARSLTATNLPGVYTLCFWPSGFLWKASARYEIKALVTPYGTDSGVFSDAVYVSSS